MQSLESLPETKPKLRSPIAQGAFHHLAAVLLAAVASADVVHDEAVDGDLSNEAFLPSVLAFGPGGNLVSGSVTVNGDFRDFITFTVPAGSALVALRQVLYSDGAGTFGSVGYHAINAGSTGLVPGFGTAGSFLGGNHMFNNMGADLLPDLAAAITNGTGFTIPLGPGDYSYVIQQSGNQHTFYILEFDIEDDWTELGGALAGVNGDPVLKGSGNLDAGSPNKVELSNAAANAPAGLFIATSSTPVPFKGGTLQPFPFLIPPIILPTDGNGGISLSFSLQPGVPAGIELWVQWGIQDAAAIAGVSLSNAVLGITP